MKPVDEQDIHDLDTTLGILEGWERDVYNPDMYSSERLSKDQREHLKKVILSLKNTRSILCEIMGPVYPVGVEQNKAS